MESYGKNGHYCRTSAVLSDGHCGQGNLPENGKIEKDLPVSDFGQLDSTQLHAMGLRSLHPADFKNIPMVSAGKDLIEIRDFLFRMEK